MFAVKMVCLVFLSHFRADFRVSLAFSCFHHGHVVAHLSTVHTLETSLCSVGDTADLLTLSCQQAAASFQDHFMKCYFLRTLHVIELFLYIKYVYHSHLNFLLFIICNAAENIHAYPQSWNFSVIGICKIK